MALLWLDLESTGLSANKDSILEVAAIVTTDDFQEVARIQRVLYFQHAATIVEMIDQYRAQFGEFEDENWKALSDILKRRGIDIHPIVLKMHDKNGLWRDCVNGLALDTVDRELAAFVLKHAVTTEEYVDAKTGETKTRKVTPQLAGSTISFDRAFINAHLPRLADEKVLHYRNCDVSTFNEVARRVWPNVYAARPNNKDKAHRGMADIEESIRVLRHYLESLTPYKTDLVAP